MLIKKLTVACGMICPHCGSLDTQKNGHRRGKQNHRCKQCGKQFVINPKRTGYSNELKLECLSLRLEGYSARAIADVVNIHHTTISRWDREYIE